MKIYSALQMGVYHTIHCEDFLVNEQIATDERLIAVLDGCTMGTESVFASILYTKILRNIARHKFYEEFVSEKREDLKTKLKQVVKELVNETKLIKNKLGLEIKELLATLIIGIVNLKSAKAEFLTIGDGLICIDGEMKEYEQNDRPDYLGYHLTENFETWFEKQGQKLSVPEFQDLSISTDGIFTFKNFEHKSNHKSDLEIIKYLLVDKEYSEFDNFLERKIKHLKDRMNQVVTDDLAIIRLIKNHSTTKV